MKNILTLYKIYAKLRVEIKIERKEVYNMSKYEKLSPEITERIAYDKEHGTRPDFAAKSALAKRRNPEADRESIWRPAYLRDVDKIMHSPYYNRYTDKTQVFSFYKNDDIFRFPLYRFR